MKRNRRIKTPCATCFYWGKSPFFMRKLLHCGKPCAATDCGQFTRIKRAAKRGTNSPKKKGGVSDPAQGAGNAPESRRRPQELGGLYGGSRRGFNQGSNQGAGNQKAFILWGLRAFRIAISCKYNCNPIATNAPQQGQRQGLFR